jgi:hypothetical protein
MLTEGLVAAVPMIDSIRPPSRAPHQCRVFLLGSFAHSIVTLRMPLIRKIRALGGHVAVGAPMAQFSQEHLALLEDAGVPVHDVPVDRHAVMNPVDELNYVRRVRAVARLERANVFIPYTIKPVVFGTFGARLAGVGRIMPMVTGLGSLSKRHHQCAPDLSAALQSASIARPSNLPIRSISKTPTTSVILENLARLANPRGSIS